MFSEGCWEETWWITMTFWECPKQPLRRTSRRREYTWRNTTGGQSHNQWSKVKVIVGKEEIHYFGYTSYMLLLLLLLFWGDIVDLRFMCPDLISWPYMIWWRFYTQSWTRMYIHYKLLLNQLVLLIETLKSTDHEYQTYIQFFIHSSWRNLDTSSMMERTIIISFHLYSAIGNWHWNGILTKIQTIRRKQKGSSKKWQRPMRSCRTVSHDMITTDVLNKCLCFCVLIWEITGCIDAVCVPSLPIAKYNPDSNEVRAFCKM